MRNPPILVLVMLSYFLSSSLQTMQAQQKNKSLDNRITSTVDSSSVKEIVLIQEFNIHVSLDSVWNAYSTQKGWENWAVPIAEFDLRNGGLIRTNYNKAGKIGDSTTIVLHIKNYVPKKLITLQAELTKHFPDFMREDEKDLYNIVYFEALEPQLTKLTSYGIGYKNTDKYRALLDFFISGNEMSYKKLISYLETGIPITH